MKKKICISPIDEDMELLAQTAWILNEFKRYGFVKRNGFLGVVTEHDGKYATEGGEEMLKRFWHRRFYSKSLNNDLEIILNKLKNS